MDNKKTMVFMTGEEKQLLLDRYQDIEWPDDVDDLRCVRCQRVAIVHYVSNCQHLFCDNCRRVFSDGGRWKCPKCQEYVTQLDYQDIDVEVKILKMTIYCPNKKYGCKYEDQLRKIPNHLMTCEDTREAALPVEYTGTNRIEAAVNQIIKVNAAIGELKEGMKEMKDKVDEKLNRLERKSGEMDSKFNALIERMDSLEKKSQDIDVERETASKKYAEESVFIRSQLESIDNRINEKESFLQLIMKQMSFNIEETKTKVVTMTEEMKTHHDKVKEQEKQMGEVDAEFKGLKMAQHALTEKMAKIEGTEDERGANVTLATTQMESVNQKIQKTESLLHQMTSNAEVMRSQMLSMTEEMKIHHDKVKMQERQMDEVNAAQLSLAQRMTRVENRNDDITKELNSATEKNKEEIQSMRSMTESIDQRIRQNESLLQQTTSNVEEMRMTMASMTQQQDTLQNKIQLRSEQLNPPKAETYEWTIKDVKKTISQDNWRIESEVFRFIGYQYDIKAKLEKKESGIFIYLQFKDGDTINQSLNKYAFTGFKYTIRDQSKSQKKKNITREGYFRFEECAKQYSWIFPGGLPDAVLSPPYTKDDCINITLSFEPPSIDRSFVSDNGVLMWTVDNYKTRKQEQLYYDLWSPTFYTSPQGYRVNTRLLINYTQPMSVAVYFLTGEHDDSLSINWTHKTTVTLFNQLDPSKNLVKSVERNNVALYTIELESSGSIEENGFIKNDSLLFKIVIEPQNSMRESGLWSLLGKQLLFTK